MWLPISPDFWKGLLTRRNIWKEHESYIGYVKTWLQYLDNYDALMYGTDWPLVNLYDYLSLLEKIIPERYWENVFYENAKRIYQL